MAATISALIRRWEQLHALRADYDALRQEIADVIDPFRGNTTRQIAPGSKRTESLFDSTALQARKLLSASLHGTLTPSTQPWISLVMRDDALNEIDEVRRFLEDCSTRLHKAYRQSAFAAAAHEMYADLVGPAATGCLFLDERPLAASGVFGGFLFRAHPPAEYTIAEDADGRVDTVFRDLRLSARAIVKRWGAASGAKVIELASTKPDQLVLVVHAVSPREDRVYNAEGKPKRAAVSLPWASCHFMPEWKHKLDEGGYHEFPFMVPRWDKASGEVYGNGPSHTAAPDVKTLNKSKEFLLQAAPLAMFPPTLEEDDSMLGDPNLSPGGRNVISAGDRPISERFLFMSTGLKIDLTQIVHAELRQAILEMYYIPQLRLKDSPQMTATEVHARLEEMYRYLGPTLSRLESEFLQPLVERSFALMARAGALPPLPQVLADLGEQAEIDVEYEGPLARAQRSIELAAEERTVLFVTSIADGRAKAPDPVWDVLKADQMVRDYGTVAGMPADQLASDEEVQQIRAAREEASRQQQELAQGVEVAKAAGAAAPMMKELREGAAAGNGGPMGRAA